LELTRFLIEWYVIRLVNSFDVIRYKNFCPLSDKNMNAIITLYRRTWPLLDKNMYVIIITSRGQSMCIQKCKKRRPDLSTASCALHRCTWCTNDWRTQEKGGQVTCNNRGKSPSFFCCPGDYGISQFFLYFLSLIN
jgi:hypothetical protein